MEAATSRSQKVCTVCTVPLPPLLSQSKLHSLGGNLPGHSRPLLGSRTCATLGRFLHSLILYSQNQNDSEESLSTGLETLLPPNGTTRRPRIEIGRAKWGRKERMETKAISKTRWRGLREISTYAISSSLVVQDLVPAPNAAKWALVSSLIEPVSTPLHCTEAEMTLSASTPSRGRLREIPTKALACRRRCGRFKCLTVTRHTPPFPCPPLVTQYYPGFSSVGFQTRRGGGLALVDFRGRQQAQGPNPIPCQWLCAPCTEYLHPGPRPRPVV